MIKDEINQSDNEGIDEFVNQLTNNWMLQLVRNWNHKPENHGMINWMKEWMNGLMLQLINASEESVNEGNRENKSVTALSEAWMYKQAKAWRTPRMNEQMNE